MSARLDRINQGYQEYANVANYWAGKNAQKQHEAHIVMQDLVRLRNEEVARINASQPSGGGGGGGPAPAPYVPPPPPPGQNQVNYTPVKIPDAEVVAFRQDQVSADALQKLYFEDVGGTEILAVARHDTVGGETVATAPIANLEDIKLQFNPLNILSSINTNELFNQFAIDMSARVWDTNDSVYGEAEWIAGVDEDGFETNTLKGYIVVGVDDLKADEYIQVQVAGNNVDYDTYDESWYNGSGGTP